SAVREYELVKKALHVAVPLLIVFTVFSVIHDLDYSTAKYLTVKLINQELGGRSSLHQPFHQVSTILHPHIGTFKYMNTLLVLIVTAGILKMVFAIARKDFRLYFARGCFRIVQDKMDEVEKMRYFVKGVNSYNLFLRRQIKLQINDLKSIYSKIVTSSSNVKNEAINKISKDFVDDSMEYATLEPVRYLCDLLGIQQTSMLSEQPLANKLKEYAAASAVIIPLIVQLFPIFLSHHT
ncbi:MAG: hypothetical protein M3044_21330, partial [Thermoproteota archaeon]|nr:hypothetical protein [Thermoproteota archaeon]